MKTGIREVKNILSYYLRKVKEGDSVIITERNVPVAQIVTYAKPSSDDLLVLRNAGLVAWNGEKPKGLKKWLTVDSKHPVSKSVAEDRR